MKIAPTVKIANVPCNGCTACCKLSDVILYPEVDDVASYETREVEFRGIPVTILKRKLNGHCVYLGESGCTIHDRAPALCRAFDCREFVLRWRAMPRVQKKTMKRNGFKLDAEIVAAGEARLATLES